jgi:hypothetical protein
MAVVLSGARQVPATTSAEFVRLAPDGAGANNVISAIIVDFRALDTVGEITVLFIAAIGVASLVLDSPYDRLRRRRRSEPADPVPASGGELGQLDDVPEDTVSEDAAVGDPAPDGTAPESPAPESTAPDGTGPRGGVPGGGDAVSSPRPEAVPVERGEGRR